jgi:hypothetical protein
MTTTFVASRGECATEDLLSMGPEACAGPVPGTDPV